MRILLLQPFRVKSVQEKNRKLLIIINFINLTPYLNTNTSKQVENTKVIEQIIIKELGKLTP
jgi:hypothetical protein